MSTRVNGRSPRKNPHAVALGRKGGKAKSEAKTAANRLNAKKKRPRKVKMGRIEAEMRRKVAALDAEIDKARTNAKKGGWPKGRKRKAANG